MKTAAFIENAWIEKCMAAWDRGWNTADMAVYFKRKESFVAMCVRMGREKRLMERKEA